MTLAGGGKLARDLLVWDSPCIRGLQSVCALTFHEWVNIYPGLCPPPHQAITQTLSLFHSRCYTDPQPPHGAGALFRAILSLLVGWLAGEGSAPRGGRFLGGHVFMGRGGGDARELQILW